MRVVDPQISYVGLVRKLVERGYGDIKITIQNVEIISVKSILCLEDEKFVGNLVLYDGISEIGFYILERFYTGEDIDINNNNIIDIIAVCLFYNEELLLQSAKKYLKSHLNETTVLCLIKLMNRMSDSKMIEFQEITCDYLYKNGYKYLNDSVILNFQVNELYYILTTPKLIVESETDLLNKLLHYKDSVIKSEDAEKDFKKLLKVINWKMIELDKVPSDKLGYLKLNSFSFFDQINNLPVRIYLKLPIELPDSCKDIIIKYYTEENKMIEIEKQDGLILLECNFINYIKSLLNIEDKKLTIVTMAIIIDLDIDYEIESAKRSNMMSQFLLWHSQENDNSVKETIPKCISYFIKSRKNVKAFQQLFGISMIFDILNHISIFSSSFRVLIKYIKNRGLTNEEQEQLNLEVQNIYNTDQFYTLLEYPTKVICKNEEVHIVPYEKPDIGRYSISPELFKGLYLDEETGTIYGKCEEDCVMKKFEITCKTPHNVLTTTLELSVNNYGFVSEYTDNKIDNIFRLSNIRALSHHCYLNFEIKDDEIWHIVYQFNDKSENDDEEIFEDFDIGFGGTTNNHYKGKNLTYEKYSFGVCFTINNTAHWVSYYNNTEKFYHECSENKDGDVFECIYNMKEKFFEIIKNGNESIVTIGNVPLLVYPFAETFNMNYAIQLSSVWKE